MYGFLLEGVFAWAEASYGKEFLMMIRKRALGTQTVLQSYEIYSEKIIFKIVDITVQELHERKIDDKIEREGVLEVAGKFFVSFAAKNGHNEMLRSLGRTLREFLNELDNLHEYIRHLFPKIKAPSFICKNETNDGITLVYRSRRRGFGSYVKGAIKGLASTFFGVDLVIEEGKSEEFGEKFIIEYRLYFDNSASVSKSNYITSDALKDKLILSDTMFSMFPFNIVFNKYLEIVDAGRSLKLLFPGICGDDMNMVFELIRPVIDYTFDQIQMHQNNVFELSSFKATQTDARELFALNLLQREEEKKGDAFKSDQIVDKDGAVYVGAKLRLKGSMIFIDEWDCIMFLGIPIIPSVEEMFKLGLYLDDLALHDSSRELVVAQSQQSAEILLTSDQVKVRFLYKSELLTAVTGDLTEALDNLDSYLYSFMPKTIESRLKNGEPTYAMSQTVEHAGIMFSILSRFEDYSTEKSPGDLVKWIDSCHENISIATEKHGIFTIRTKAEEDIFVHGIPDWDEKCFDKLLLLAFDLIRSCGDELQIGIHCGSVIAGIVGLKVQSYRVFGDTVTYSHVLSQTAKPGKIHIDSRIMDSEAICKQYFTTKAKRIDNSVTTYYISETAE